MEDIKDYFIWAQEDRIEQRFLRQHSQTEQEHGRITTWRVSVCDAGWFQNKEDWPFLHTFISVERTCTRQGHTSNETAWFISSLQADAAMFYRLTRNHWSIENQLHWVLDVSFHEDASLLHENNAVQNLSLLRKFALSALKADFSRIASINRKRKIAAIDDLFALSLLALV